MNMPNLAEKESGNCFIYRWGVSFEEGVGKTAVFRDFGRPLLYQYYIKKIGQVPEKSGQVQNFSANVGFVWGTHLETNVAVVSGTQVESNVGYVTSGTRIAFRVVDSCVSAHLYQTPASISYCIDARCMPFAQGPSEDIQFPIREVVIAGEKIFESELDKLEQEMEGLMEGLLAGTPIQVTDKMRVLSKEVIQQRDKIKEADIEAWARRLAEGVSKLTD